MLESEGQMGQDNRRVEINISGIPVAGIGGLGLVAMAVLVSVMMPAAGGTLLTGLAGGIVLAVGLVIARRHIKSKGPSGDDPTILFRALPPEGGSHASAQRERRSPDSELLTANC